MNKILTVLFLISFVFYTVTNPLGGDTPFKWVVYALMILLPISNCFNSHCANTYWKRYSKWFIVFTVLFVLQIVFAHEKVINNIILWGAFICLSMQLAVRGVDVSVYKTLILCLTMDYILGLPGLASSISSAGYAAGWEGIFQNPNTHSIFLCACMISVLLGCSNRKIRLVVLVAILMGIFATRSRNALLVYCMIVGGFMFEYKLARFQKWFPLCLVGILIFAGYYMLVIEPSVSSGELNMMGKSEGSAGRSLQIIYLTTHFDLSLWGNGRYINSIVEDNTGYPVHNMFIASFYVLGLLISAAYLWFVYWLYTHNRSYKFKVCLLAVHFYFFFEPGYFFCVQLSYFLPMFVLCCLFWKHANYSKSYSVKTINFKTPKLLANL